MVEMSSSQASPVRRIAQVGPMRVDLESGAVYGPGGASGLNRRSESLFVYLCRRANTLVTREEILEQVWEGRPVEDAAITNCVWYIRRAIGDHEKRILQTHAKRGYWLALPESAWISLPQPQRDSLGATRPVGASRSQLAWVFAAICATILLLFALVLSLRSQAPAVQTPTVEMPQRTLTMSMPARGMAPGRAAAMREAAIAALSRDYEFLLLQDKPAVIEGRGHVHFAVDAPPDAGGGVVLTLVATDGTRRAATVAQLDHLPERVRRFLNDALGGDGRPVSPALEAYVHGRLAEMRFDRIRAIGHYRSALARDPHMARARFALASNLHRQGRSAEALRWAQAVDVPQGRPGRQDCRLARLRALLQPEHRPAGGCAQVDALIALQQGQYSAAIARIDNTGLDLSVPEIWLDMQKDGILAALRGGQWTLAQERIVRARSAAERAGWRWGAQEIDAMRALPLLFEGRVREAAQIHAESAAAYARIGDLESADSQTLYSLRATPTGLGPASGERREVLRGIIERAQSMGSVGNELDALFALARVDRGHSGTWQRHLARILRLSESMLTSGDRIQNRMYVLDEYRFARRYDAVIAGLPGGDDVDTDTAIWRDLLEFEARFGRDELNAAAAVVSRMQRRHYELSDTGGTCQFAWLFAENGDIAQSRELLARCREQSFDRLGQAIRGDHGVLAQAKLLRLNGRPDAAWATLAPRLRALVALEDASAQELESMLTLARHASDLADADLRLLHDALALGKAAAALDGAGPTLRFGVHALRWRLCVRERRADCGAPLPAWAHEDRFELRLALQHARQYQTRAGDSG